MKKQWLSMILVLCMVLCMAPATARAAEGETGTLRVITKVIGLPDSVSAEGKTFTFKVGMKLPGGIAYLSTPLVITIGADGRTGEGLMEVTSGYQYLVVETAHDDIDDYRWDYVTYPGGGYNESKMVQVDANTVSVPIYVNRRIGKFNDHLTASDGCRVCTGCRCIRCHGHENGDGGYDPII